MKSLKKLFTDHPADQQETYLQHAVFASKVAVHLFLSSAFLMIHAVLPFICPPEPFDLKSTKKFIDDKCKCRSDD